MSVKQHVPNALTCANLVCGCAAILSTVAGNGHHAVFYLLGSLIFDFLDGFAARLLNVASPLGKQLDSLADMVSFGVVPGMILFHLFLKSNFFVLIDNRMLYTIFKYSLFINTVFSAVRLAKFNMDHRQVDYFIGLPTPANTIFIASLPLILAHDHFGLRPYILNPMILVGIALLFSALMVAPIPMLALKFKNFNWQDNKPQFLLIIIVLLMIPVLKFAAVPAAIIAYLILSILFKNEIVKIIQ